MAGMIVHERGAHRNGTGTGWRTSDEPLWTRALTTLRRWQQRSRMRRRLERLDDRMLADIGLDRRQAQAEAEKPFWRR